MVAAARAKEAIVPGHCANATIMATKRLQQLVLGCIPDLEFARVSADRELGTVARPLYAGYTVIWPDITQLGHFAVLGGIEVDAGAEADGEDVLRRPVDQIKVKVVLQARCVEHIERLLGDHALLSVPFREQLLLLKSAINWKGNPMVLLIEKLLLLRLFDVGIDIEGVLLLLWWYWESHCGLILLTIVKGLRAASNIIVDAYCGSILLLIY